jgi:hypothetical protein
MYLTRGGNVQRTLISGPRGWSAGQISWPADQLLCRFGPKLCGHVSTQEGEAKAVKKVSGGQTHWPPGHYMASYHLGQVGGAPLRPYKYTPTGGN